MNKLKAILIIGIVCPLSYLYPMAVAEKLVSLFTLKQENYHTRDPGGKAAKYICDKQVMRYIARFSSPERQPKGFMGTICAESSYEDTHKFVTALGQELGMTVVEYDVRTIVKMNTEEFKNLSIQIEQEYEKANKRLIVHFHHFDEDNASRRYDRDDLLFCNILDKFSKKRIGFFISTKSTPKNIMGDLTTRTQSTLRIEDKYVHYYFNDHRNKENLLLQAYNRKIILLNSILVGGMASVTTASLLWGLEKACRVALK